MTHSTTSRLVGAALALCASVLPVASGCTNTKYPDLMRVTAECDATIAQQEKIYSGSESLAARIDARERIISLREKQMIMARRINVKTMPEVRDNLMSIDQAQARKGELVKAATERYDAARALPVPTAAPASTTKDAASAGK